MIEDKFRKKYPKLSGFLSAFIIQSYEDVSDDAIIARYPPQYFSSKIEGIEALKEGKEVLVLNPFPEDIIHTKANIWFETTEETKAWLKSIINKLEKRVEEEASISLKFDNLKEVDCQPFFGHKVKHIFEIFRLIFQIPLVLDNY